MFNRVIHTNKLEILGEIGRFLEKHNLPKVTQG